MDMVDLSGQNLGMTSGGDGSKAIFLTVSYLGE